MSSKLWYFICWLLSVVVVFTCLQHIFAAFDLHGVHLPSSEVFKSFLTLRFSIKCVPVISGMFLNAVIISFLKISLTFLFICKIFQFLLTVFVIFGRNWLYIIRRGILSDFCDVSFSVIRSILLHRLILLGCLLINAKWYACLRSCFSFRGGYCLNLLDLNLFAWFGWLGCKVNYFSIILHV